MPRENVRDGDSIIPFSILAAINQDDNRQRSGVCLADCTRHAVRTQPVSEQPVKLSNKTHTP